MKNLFYKQYLITGFIALMFIFSVFTIISCRETYDKPNPVVLVTGVTVTPASITVKTGDAPFQITAAVSPANASNSTVTWSVHPEGIVNIMLCASFLKKQCIQNYTV